MREYQKKPERPERNGPAAGTEKGSWVIQIKGRTEPDSGVGEGRFARAADRLPRLLSLAL